MHDRSRPLRSGLPVFAPTIGLREVLEASPDLVFSTDGWGRLAWASSTFEAYTGRRAKDCVGTPAMSLIAPADAPGVVRALLWLRRRGGTLQRAFGLRQVDGSTVPVETRFHFAETAEGERYLVGIARRRDATQVPMASASSSGAAVADRVGALEQSLAAARQAVRVKGDFLATMSHEIRTPINGVMGVTSLLLQGELPSEARQLVELIRDSTQSLLAMINDTLDYSRLEAGKMPVEHLDFDLRVTLEQIGGVLRSLAGVKRLAFDAHVDAVVPSRLTGDPGRLRQVLLNLGSNAVKFTERGSVTLHFQVTDTGIGVDRAEQGSLFEPYAQANAGIPRTFGGTGLGLAISKRLVETLGGELGFDSTPGSGSTFWFRLKLEKQPELLGNTPTPANEFALRGVRVLVADGNAGEREPVADVLQAWGCDVGRAENGLQALRMMRDAAAAGAPFTVALVDRHLELLDGEQFGQAVRADHALDAAQLVMVTNLGRPGDAGRVKAAGFTAYLMKPLDPPQLYEALGEVLQPTDDGVAAGDRPLVTRHSLAEARRGRVRILLVDDDPVNQLVTTSALHRVGYNIEVANSGRRAIDLTENERWDLILMDMQMPDLDGCRTTAAIRARERGAWRTPIIGLTASSDHKPDRDRCLASGMDLVLGKPINLEQLTHTVEKYTTREGRPAEIETPSQAMRLRLTVVSSRFDVPLTSAPAEPRPAPRLLPAAGAGDAAAVSVVPEGPAIDLEQLETACMGLPALRSSLLHTFLNDVVSRIDRLKAAFESGETRRVEFEAHGLKGMCATIGAGGCTMLFGEIEELAREEQIEEARLVLPASIDEVHRTEQFIRRFDSILAREVA